MEISESNSEQILGARTEYSKPYEELNEAMVQFRDTVVSLSEYEALYRKINEDVQLLKQKNLELDHINLAVLEQDRDSCMQKIEELRGVCESLSVSAGKYSKQLEEVSTALIMMGERSTLLEN